ncbi:MAG: ABC transporter permease [Coriobacteriia bacterium]|nr:ABC transporter permease [Coriobacteriia bacterium]MBN2823323.1 ABC transporter permease [Coriobacteriia bacterium]
MGGFKTFLRKEFREIFKTWRIWVLPGIVLFFAISGPVLTAFTPELLKTVTTEQPGVIIQIPDPTFLEAYAEWIGNLSQIVLFAAIIIFGGMVSGEKKSGTAMLVLTKPITRTAFVLAKFVSNLVLLVCTVAVGTAVTWGVTLAMFGEAPAEKLLVSTGLFLILAILFLGVMTLFSSLVDSQAGSAGLGILILVVLSLLGLWGPALEYSPAGIMSASSSYLMGKDPSLLWPSVTSVVVTLLALAGGAFVFSRREL